MNDFTKVSYTNVKYDIKHLKYITESIQSSVENITNILENGTYNSNNKMETLISNILTSNDNIPINDEETLQNFEKSLDSQSFRHQIVSNLINLYFN